MIPERIASHFRITGILGEGGMGAVLAAIDERSHEEVAIKIVRPEYAASDAMARRFAREALVATRLHHENIAKTHEAGVDSDLPYMVMERLSGRTLGAVLRDQERLSLEETLSIAREILHGLAHAHAQGVIHRDLKPDNVFLAEAGGRRRVKLLDFGISKLVETPTGTSPLQLTRKDTVLGTPYYLSPEQARALPDVDARADLFGLGTILFECLAGRPPFLAKSYELVIVAVCTTDAPPIHSFVEGIPQIVASWIAQALARDRDARFPSASAMLSALDPIATTLGIAMPTTAEPPNPSPLACGTRSRPATRSPISMTTRIALALALGALVAVFGAWIARR